MRVLYHLHGFPPHHNAGAELYALEVLRWLRARGHEAEVLINPVRWPAAAGPTEDGILITKRASARWDARVYERNDVVLTHLDETPLAMRLASSSGRPLVHIIHNDRQLQFHKVTPASAALAVANSSWTAASVPKPIPTLTVFPPCPPHRYEVPAGGDAILLVNPSIAKGAPLVYELARRHPELPFLIVGGGYGRQMPPPELPNLELWHNQADPRTYYAEARLVLMPSLYESFGRVPIEAAASGIPTIARPTPGILEALAGAGTYVGDVPPPELHHAGTDDERLELLLAEVDQWDAALVELLGSKVSYATASAAAASRARRLWVQTSEQLEDLEAALLELAD